MAIALGLASLRLCDQVFFFNIFPSRSSCVPAMTCDARWSSIGGLPFFVLCSTAYRICEFNFSTGVDGHCGVRIPVL
jgi:hypothetical protein